jgi:hypothetical protein
VQNVNHDDCMENNTDLGLKYGAAKLDWVEANWESEGTVVMRERERERERNSEETFGVEFAIIQ